MPRSNPGPCRLRAGEAVALSFNRITVDGDMSTNDTVLLLANGRSGMSKLGPSPEFRKFQEAVTHAFAWELAKMIVRDGIHRVVTPGVSGAPIAEADAGRPRGGQQRAGDEPARRRPDWGASLTPSDTVRPWSPEDWVTSAARQRRKIRSLKRGQPTRASFRPRARRSRPTEFDTPCAPDRPGRARRSCMPGIRPRSTWDFATRRCHHGSDDSGIAGVGVDRTGSRVRAFAHAPL